MAISPATAADRKQPSQKFFRREESNPKAKILISGQVRTADGTPLPDGAKLRYYSAYSYRCDYIGGTNMSYYGGHHRPLAPSGRFLGSPVYGYEEDHYRGRVKFYFTATAPGYAPTWIGPFKAKPSGSIKKLDIILNHGFEGRLILTDQSGKPVVGAKLEMRYLAQKSSLPGELMSGEDGTVVIPDCATAWVEVHIRHSGYQQSRFKIKLTPDKIKKHKLHRADPTIGSVVSSESGQPIKNAKVLILKERSSEVTKLLFSFITLTSPVEHGFSLRSAPVVGRSDELGRFTVDTFRNGDSYDLAITAPGYKTARLAKIQSRQKNLAVELAPLPAEASPQ